MDATERSLRWQRAHPERRREISRQWRKRNPATMSFMNRRNKLAYRLMVEWVRHHRPDIYLELRKESRRRLPASDLDIEREMG